MRARSTAFEFLKLVVNSSASFVKFGSRLTRKFMSSCVSLLFSEYKAHLKYYDQLKSKEVKTICFFEFEFLVNSLHKLADYSNDENYKRIRETFNDLTDMTIGSVKLMAHYRAMIKRAHIINHPLFAVNMILSNV
jgi:hypothetical protein